ncbi:hypothetical protein L228DRAFT_240469 [Xylona heveae TC161]|uniref:Uncharacterized protein n=1 Tax=Xylona heveae (strain CBS 132557 / TC161) TaxID=1328760 RepID=A0A165F8L4_XYLHT|nr:hypothetical protein L228DRAFT_240469 [Xylona heveae TC161]KZF20705.1 hypothetical protein L228DRAFT_240469 [Xylona heveae TC161]
MPTDQDVSSPTDRSRSNSVPTSSASSHAPVTAANKRSQPSHPSESPAKKQSKWSPEEDALIIDLRGKGMKWEDISKRLAGRSAISCRLHYQNYLERRSEWDEEKKNKLARLYERFKPEMWAKVAEEMAIPWRAAEAMHWQLGEQDMARRAGVVPFSLSSTSTEPAQRGRRPSLGTSRSRRESAPRAIGPPPQLPPVSEVTAGAYPLPFDRPMERKGLSPPEPFGGVPRRYR